MCEKCVFTIHSEEQQNKHMMIRHDGEDGVLWVADSILSNVDFDFLSQRMKKKVKRVKAYTAVYDEQAKFPDKNFLDVIDKELSNGSFNTLLIGGGSVDISNLDTTSDPEMNLQALSEQVLKSAHKLFSIAEAALQKFPAIRKVIIMKRTPRYDLLRFDPLSLKPQLSSLADSASFRLWCESKFKNKIVLGGQDIPAGDTEHKEVFGNPDDKSYDGIHMRGPAGRSFLTRSIQKVLTKAKLINENSELYEYEYATPVPDSKRQKVFAQHEQFPHGRKPSQRYNPMGLMIDRIRTVSSATQNARKDDQYENDEVFKVPHGKNNKTRASVIRATQRDESSLQKHYNVPVHNSFTNLLN